MITVPEMKTDNEIWRPIVGFEGLYEVSDLGRVRSLDRQISDSAGRTYWLKGKVLKGSSGGGRYRLIFLHDGPDRTVPMYLHDIVAAAFIGPKPPGAVTRHRDDDPLNNRPENLAYGSQKENLADAVKNGGYRVSDGHQRARITGEDVRTARQSGMSTKEAANFLGCCARYARSIMNGERRKYD